MRSVHVKRHGLLRRQLRAPDSHLAPELGSRLLPGGHAHFYNSPLLPATCELDGEAMQAGRLFMD